MDWKAFVLLGVVLVIFFVSFIANQKTKKPDGCEISDHCSNCQMTNCYIKNNQKNGEKHER